MTLRDGQFEYLFGAPDEARVIRKLGATVRAAKLKHDMKDLTISQVGHTPQGFGFGRAMAAEMQKTFGATVEGRIWGRHDDRAHINLYFSGTSASAQSVALIRRVTEAMAKGRAALAQARQPAIGKFP
jgi:hypothetical protein